MMVPHSGRVALMLSLLASLALRPAAAQEPPAPPGAACTAVEHRQFDFWIGTWEVRNPAGTVVGRNVIEAIHSGCVIYESWRGASGSEGNSFNIYDARRRQWHQTWVDNQGTLLLLDGGPDANGSMKLEGASTGPDGRSVRNRITWTPLGEDRVRQHWEVQREGETGWSTIFDGDYRREPAPDSRDRATGRPSDGR